MENLSSLVENSPAVPTKMPEIQENHRPLPLASTDTYTPLAIAQIVSPIVPLKMSEEMRNTLRISESIRQQQTHLIAASNLENKESLLPAKSASDLATNAESDTSSDHQQEPHGDRQGESSNETPETSPIVDRGNTPTPATSEDATGPKESNSSETSEQAPARLCSPASEQELASFDRLALSFGRKKLKRDRAPGPLQIPNHGRGISPAINSAPIRTYYTGFTTTNGYNIPTGYPGRGGHAGHGLVGPIGAGGAVARLQGPIPAAGPLGQPRRVQMRPFLQPVSYPNVHVVQTPLRRTIPIVYERRVAKPRGKERRKPVLDVFLNDVTKEAPMHSQPPSAQREYFEGHEDDRSNATEEEMREMESKRQAHSAVQGTISFNNESAFNFKIFAGRDQDAKEKFMKMCETTWEQYVAGLS